MTKIKKGQKDKQRSTKYYAEKYRSQIEQRDI